MSAIQQSKLSCNDQRELGRLPGKIQKLEKHQIQLEEIISASGFYQSNYE